MDRLADTPGTDLRPQLSLVAVTALTATGTGPYFTIPVCLEQGRMFFVAFTLFYLDFYDSLFRQSFFRECAFYLFPYSRLG